MRPEKLMRLLEVSKEMHGGKAELSTITNWRCISGQSRKWKKSRELLRGVDLDFPVGVTWGVITMTLRVCFDVQMKQ